jgi:outer membrane lipoprotein-sorting protein
MLKRIILFIVAISVIAILSANHDKLQSDLQQKYAAIRTFEADLTQSIHHPSLDITMESTGRFFIDNDAFVIEFLKPMSQFVKLENGRMTMYIADDNTAFISEDSGVLPSGAFIMSDLLGMNSNFTFIQEEKGLSVFRVTMPVDPSQNVRIHVNQRDVLLSKIEILGDSGETTLIELKNQRFNRPLSKRLSDFVVPASANIIHH